MNSKERKGVICIAGCARSDTRSCGPEALEVGRLLGGYLADKGAMITSSSTTGFSLWTAIGAQGKGAMTTAFSPAGSPHEHTDIFRLPTDYFDLIVYTGFGSAGAGTMAVRSSDAVIFGAGGISSITECTVAVEEGKIIGILEGDWEADHTLEQLIIKHYPDYSQIIRDNDPKRLSDQIMARITTP